MGDKICSRHHNFPIPHQKDHKLNLLGDAVNVEARKVAGKPSSNTIETSHKHTHTHTRQKAQAENINEHLCTSF